MIFTDDVVLVDKIGECANLKMEIWRNTLKAKGFKLNRVIIKYLKCNYSNKASTNERKVRMDNIEIGRNRSFWYIGFIIHKGRKLMEDVTNRIKVV